MQTDQPREILPGNHLLFLEGATIRISLAAYFNRVWLLCFLSIRSGQLSLPQCWSIPFGSPPTAAAILDGMVYINTQLNSPPTDPGGVMCAIDISTGTSLWNTSGYNNTCVGK